MHSGRVLGVDVGGTFTDVVAVVDGGLTTAKVPTTTDQSEGVLSGIEVACEGAGIEPGDVDRFRHATTVAVNALLEGTGAPTALVTTAGFRDLLAIGRQDRPELYDLRATRPDPLVPAERRYAVDERATVDGIERRVDDEDVRALADRIDADAVAVAFLHAYAHPENERRAAAALREELAVPVSASHEVLGTFREYERTATTVADATLRPVVGEYLDGLEERATARGLPAPRVLQSNGGVADAATVSERAVTAVLSGPAAGVVGAAAFEPPDAAGLITFDVGGTSTDVSLVRDGEVARTTEADVAGRPVRVPMVDVETVGAGGGSIAWVDDGGALRVGPRSAGADPGPACYGRGGDEPTVTDAAVHLGYLGADATLGEDLGLDADAAANALADLADAAELADAEAAARGVYRVAGATTARAVRRVTVERGHDPREFALAAYGGAGPMLATALAERLGVETVVVPRASGVLSAYGLLAADEVHDAARTHRTALRDADPERIEAGHDALAASVRADVAGTNPVVERTADCRYVGQSHELTVAAPDPFDADRLRERFHAAHERERGYRVDEEPVELVSLRARARVAHEAPAARHDGPGDALLGRRESVFDGGESTTVCPPGWTATADDRGTLRLEVTDA